MSGAHLPRSPRSDHKPRAPRGDHKPRAPRDVARQVIEIEAAALRGLLDQLDGAFDDAVATIKACTGRVVCTGMGKSGLVMKKVAATLASTGTPAFFLHPAEAIHGDLGMLMSGDLVLAASYSGTTEELLRLVETLRRLGLPLIAITGNPASPLARNADVHLSAAIDKEACPLNLAPTASTTATLALGDALAMALIEARGFTAEDFARLHPGGQLGKQLLRVRELMHSGDDLPVVPPETPMRDAIYEMSRKKLGITAVAEGDRDAGATSAGLPHAGAQGAGLRLLGCISDGDLRRLLEHDDGLLRHTAGECMRTNPRTIDPDQLASAALKTMEDHRITSLFVCESAAAGGGAPAGERLLGIVHLHDLWRLELF